MKEHVSAKKAWVAIIVAALLASVCAVGLWGGVRLAHADETLDPAPLCLYDATQTSITSAPLGENPEYFGKPASITIGTGDNAASYPKVLQLLLKGPFESGNLGTYYSALTYDVSSYNYNYFSVTVGNNSKGGDGYTNHILYKVMVDGVVLARSTHALEAYEAETLSCAIPAGAQEIRLHAQSEDGPAYGECNWANATLWAFKSDGKVALRSVPVSGNSTDPGMEAYEIGSATLAQGTAQALTDANAILGAIHGDYGNNTWKFSADYDISSKNYTRFTADAGMRFGRTENSVYYKVMAIDGANAATTLQQSESIDGTTFHHFDVTIPQGTVKLQLWAQSSANHKACGNIAWCNATLYYSDSKITPVRYGEITVTGGDSLTAGDAFPALSGVFRSGKAVIPGTVAFDAGQTLAAGTNEYNYTFTPADTVGYNVATGTVSLTAEARVLEEVNLYDLDYTTITSAPYPETEPYFAKRPNITLGRGANEFSYAKTLQLLVNGPFDTAGLGTYYSGLTYDISDYDFDYFSVTVGNANCAVNANTGEVEFTNKILYRVMADGVELVRSSHALSSFETERLTCAIPEGTQELRLHAQSEAGKDYGECNWANPVLTNFEIKSVTEAALTSVPVSGNNTVSNEEKYAVASATLAQGTDKALTDTGAITGAIHGDYGNNTWKFSADYDISGGKYNRLTVDAGMLYGETANNVVFRIRAIGGTNCELGVSPAMNGTDYYHFDVEIPAGTTSIQLWAQSQSNTKAYGELAWCNATLYSGGKPTPKLIGDVTSLEANLEWGDTLPELGGNFTVERATVLGTLALDAGQSIEYGTHSYDWTFTPLDGDAFSEVSGSIELTAGKRTVDMSGVTFTDARYDYDGEEKTLTLTGTLPAGVSADYSDNKLTAPGSTDAIVTFEVTENAELYNEIPSMTATLTVDAVTMIAASDASKTYTLGANSDVTFTLAVKAVNASVKLGTSTLDGEKCTVADKSVTFKSAYLESLGAGKHEFTVTCEGGEFTLKVEVKEAAATNNGGDDSGDKLETPKKKGCKSDITGVASLFGGLALIACAFVAAKKRRHA